MKKILVSACLLGYNCKYDGTNNLNNELLDYLKDYEIIPICPEVMGGLLTPRDASEIKDNKVISIKGIDVTKEFINGAKKTLEIAKENNINLAILKSKSPSCGLTTYDGSFTKNIINRPGICAKLLMDNNIKVISSDNFKEEL